MEPCEKWNSSAGRILRIQSEISVQVCFEGAASCEMEYLCADVEESALEVIAVAPATFILNRPGWYKEKVLASGFPVLAVGSVFVVIAMTTQICERINERMVPLNRIILMAIGGLCIFAASIVFTVAVIMGNKQEEHAIVCATARIILMAIGGLCIFAASIVFTVAVIMGNKQEEYAIVCATAGSGRAVNNAGSELIDANAQVPVVKGSLRPPRSQRSIPSERNMRGSINSEGSIGHSKRIGQRDAKVERRTLRSDRHSHRSGGRSLSSGEQSQRSTSRRGVPTEQIPQI
uniref:MARVEL domain-containing protein n=1 Tax=Ascaris lumbricoides TaxID=6252 RepID=A0A0M3I1B8_ASCLU